MTEALINSEVLRWARKRAKLNSEQLAEKMDIKLDKLLLWEEGEARPTFNQAQDLAQVLHVPFGFLFLPKPPKETLPIPDLRTVGSHAAGSLSTELRDLLLDVLRKQDWFRDYLLDLGTEPLPFIGRYGIDADAMVIADDLTKTLGLTIKDRESAKNWEDFLGLLMDKSEETGVWVMRSGIVGSNTHRGLNVQEFRGFAICDDIAPVVFINGKDSKAAQIFTLMHELAHLWIGQSGVSDLSLAQPADTSHRQVEKLSNAVAAEVLLPQDVFGDQWRIQDSLDANAARLSSFFRVSTVVVARRAFDAGLINWINYFDYYQKQMEIWQKKKKSNGGDPYRTIPVRNGKRFTFSVLHSVFERRLLLRDAGKLLSVNPAKIDRLAQEMRIR